LLLMPALHNLPPGYHGFHLHSRPSCLNAGKAAGSHWDPKQTAHHRGPYRSGGHRGDLPVLYVDSSGSAQRAVLAPRLTVSDLIGHAFVIHRDGDNYTDRPKNGGGGGRMACGVVLKRSFRS
jgi:Cu-Zn family superoxide dismutase